MECASIIENELRTNFVRMFCSETPLERNGNGRGGLSDVSTRYKVCKRIIFTHITAKY